MLTFLYDAAGALVDVLDHDARPPAGELWASGRAKDRNDIKTWDEAEAIAAAATTLKGRRFLATETEGRWPRFDVIAAPEVGDACSYAFNGDYYPDGVVARISPDFRIVTSSTGKRYFRRRRAGAWLHKGMWCLVAGRVSRLNQEF